MLVVAANLLLALAGLPFLLLMLGRQSFGPEGPVGFHMVTLPLALGMAGAIALSACAGRLQSLGIHGSVALVCLPGLVIALAALPALGLELPWRPLHKGLGVAAVAAVALLVNGTESGTGRSLAGAAAMTLGILSLGGYSLVASMAWEHHKNAFAAVQADRERMTAFEERQAAWQLAEWAKLPPEPELWQCIQFTHAFHPAVRRACHERIAAIPDLDQQMQRLLGSGWAEHALAYIEQYYPRSRASLAGAMADFMDHKLPEWQSTLATAQIPSSYFGNLASVLQAAAAIAGDGGDLSRACNDWVPLLKGKAGLEPLHQLAKQLAGKRA
jgi:hypothetical protein